MHIVIDIPEDSYKATCNGCMLPSDVEHVVQGIKNGIPLPDTNPNLQPTCNQLATDCISRQAVLGLKIIAPIAPVTDGEVVHYEEVIFVRDLEKLSSVVPERKHGHWIMQNDRSKKLLGWSFCSECNAWIGEPTDYCSNCGADMREVDG